MKRKTLKQETVKSEHMRRKDIPTYLKDVTTYLIVALVTIMNSWHWHTISFSFGETSGARLFCCAKRLLLHDLERKRTATM